MQAHAKSLNGIINTVSAAHEMVPLLGLLDLNGKIVCVGVPPEPMSVPAFPLLASESTTQRSSHPFLPTQSQLLSLIGTIFIWLSLSSCHCFAQSSCACLIICACLISHCSCVHVWPMTGALLLHDTGDWTLHPLDCRLVNGCGVLH